MKDFKIGNKVRIIGNKSGSANEIGDVGIVKYVTNDNCVVEVKGYERSRIGVASIFSDLELVSDIDELEIF